MNKLSIVFFAFCLAVVYANSPPKPNCAVENCGGPWRFYKEIGCKAVYKTPGDCCPIRYDCDHLKTRSNKKCYAFGKEFNIGEEVRGEGGTRGCFNPCICLEGPGTKASFTCALASPLAPPKPGCYYPRNATSCGFGPEVCFDKPENIPTCQVGDKTVKAGEQFSPENNPRISCWCGPGYNGENVTPFCKDTTTEFCGSELHYGTNIANSCAPLFDLNQDIRLDCNYYWRCHEEGDKVIPRDLIIGGTRGPAPVPLDEPGMECKLGPLTLKHYEGVNRVINDKCTACVCEVPPTPTCVNLPKGVCSV